MILDGRKLSDEIKGSLRAKVSVFTEKTGRKPCLAVVLVGSDPSSCVYVKNKQKACDEIGFSHIDLKFPDCVTETELLDKIYELNSNASVDGILVQLPLPLQINRNKVINAIMPSKDVDGFTPYNTGKLLLEQETVIPCTPKGVLRLFEYYGITTEGKSICILGRSNIVGKPLAALLMQKSSNATVTVCNSYTADIASKLRNADIVISAAGKPGLVKAEMIHGGAIVIDVGITRVEDSSKKSGYRLCGDVDFEEVCKKASMITPVPGGVGPMTVAMLMENTLIAACNNENLDFKAL